MINTINTDEVIYQYFDKSHIEEITGRTFTPDEWEEFLDDTQDDFGYYTSQWMQARCKEMLTATV